MGDAGKKIFLDTNVLIYAYSETEEEKKAKVLPLHSLSQVVKNLFDLYHVGVINDSTITKAMDMSSRLKLPYWDSLIVSSALEAGCDMLYTEDLQHGQVIENRLTVKNPFLDR